jgi:hypothetical protein
MVSASQISQSPETLMLGRTFGSRINPELTFDEVQSGMWSKTGSYSD